MARVNPNARPRTLGSVASAIMASRAAERIPLPKRSVLRTRSTCQARVAMPITGREQAASA